MSRRTLVRITAGGKDVIVPVDGQFVQQPSSPAAQQQPCIDEQMHTPYHMDVTMVFHRHGRCSELGSDLRTREDCERFVRSLAEALSLGEVRFIDDGKADGQ